MRVVNRLLLGALGLVCASPVSGQTGLTYRFRADTLTGQVWVQGDNARRELTSGEGGRAAGRVEIWKDGGKQLLILSPADQTYYDGAATPALSLGTQPRLAALTVRPPFRVEGVEDVRVEVKTLPALEQVSSYTCRRSIVTFSYTLTVSIVGPPGKPLATSGTIPARVEGTDDVCVMEASEAPRLPLDHALEWRSTLADVDRAITARMSTLKGIPVVRTLKASRQIEGGEKVSGTATMALSDIREAQAPADRFEVPKGYRVKLPVITPPTRQ